MNDLLTIVTENPDAAFTSASLLVWWVLWKLGFIDKIPA
jgi:hypothetical protein